MKLTALDPQALADVQRLIDSFLLIQPENRFFGFLKEQSRAFTHVRHTLHKGQPKHCFYNAYRLAAASRYQSRYTYVEGYAARLIPVHHAWVIDRDGNVIDPTWNGQGTAYFGIPFRTPYIVRHGSGPAGGYSVLAYNADLLSGNHSNWSAQL